MTRIALTALAAAALAAAAVPAAATAQRPEAASFARVATVQLTLAGGGQLPVEAVADGAHIVVLASGGRVLAWGRIPRAEG
jgi:hypothetical protein